MFILKALLFAALGTLSIFGTLYLWMCVFKLFDKWFGKHGTNASMAFILFLSIFALALILEPLLG
jgi:hypothetical protein